METINTETTETVVFGLRYLEEEEAEISDVVGCAIPQDPDFVGGATCTACDDVD
jgi:hypothetical protein